MRTATALWARTIQGLGARMTRSKRLHDKDVHATEEFCRDRDFPVVTDLGSDKKQKKKTPGIWGVTAWYQSISIRIPKTRWAWV